MTSLAENPPSLGESSGQRAGWPGFTRTVAPRLRIPMAGGRDCGWEPGYERRQMADANDSPEMPMRSEMVRCILEASECDSHCSSGGIREMTSSFREYDSILPESSRAIIN